MPLLSIFMLILTNQLRLEQRNDSERMEAVMGDGFDLVILDLIIPGGMGGMDAIAELLKIDPEVRAIVSSGYSTDTILSKYTKNGFKGFVEKPFTMMKLSKVVHDVLEEK